MSRAGLCGTELPAVARAPDCLGDQLRTGARHRTHWRNLVRMRPTSVVTGFCPGDQTSMGALEARSDSEPSTVAGADAGYELGVRVDRGDGG